MKQKSIQSYLNALYNADEPVYERGLVKFEVYDIDQYRTVTGDDGNYKYIIDEDLSTHDLLGVYEIGWKELVENGIYTKDLGGATESDTRKHGKIVIESEQLGDEDEGWVKIQLSISCKHLINMDAGWFDGVSDPIVFVFGKK